MELTGKKIAFLGDSITAGGAATCMDNCFVNLIASRENATCINYGIGATRIAKQHKPSIDPREDQDFVSRVPGLDPDADAIVVFGGTNDFGHGDAPIGCFDDRTVDTFYGAVHTLFIKLIEKYPGKPIAVLTPLHRLNEDNTRGDGGKNPPSLVLKGYVDIIREVAEYYSLPVLDLYATSGMQPKVPAVQKYLMPDGLHPSDAGHDILARRIVQFLKQL